MVALKTPEVKEGWQALDFSLKGIDGRNYSLKDIESKNGLVVMFICNHCPFVKAIAGKLAEDMEKLAKLGVNAIAINSNDTLQYPEDSFENMRLFAHENNFKFPYVIDETQEVARNYGAVCTPDFFGFDKNLKLQYRGRFDSSGMNHAPDAKHDLLEAMQELAKTGKISARQYNSIGCNIKWKGTI